MFFLAQMAPHVLFKARWRVRSWFNTHSSIVCSFFFFFFYFFIGKLYIHPMVFEPNNPTLHLAPKREGVELELIDYCHCVHIGIDHILGAS